MVDKAVKVAKATVEMIKDVTNLSNAEIREIDKEVTDGIDRLYDKLLESDTVARANDDYIAEVRSRFVSPDIDQRKAFAVGVLMAYYMLRGAKA